jgi:uncharacterized protein (DUF1330 family)
MSETEKPVKPAMMIIYMDIVDPAWIEPYFQVVPGLLEEYGAVSVAGSRRISSIEGDWKAPDRMAAISFPSMEKLKAFMADERYAPYKEAREKGAKTQIFVFENAVAGTTKLSV